MGTAQTVGGVGATATVGGVTAMAAGHVYMGGGTRVQKAVGVEDSADDMFTYLVMNTLEPDGNLFAAGLIATAVLEGAYTIAPDFSYVEQLITSAEPIVPAG